MFRMELGKLRITLIELSPSYSAGRQLGIDCQALYVEGDNWSGQPGVWCSHQKALSDLVALRAKLMPMSRASGYKRDALTCKPARELLAVSQEQGNRGDRDA